MHLLEHCIIIGVIIGIIIIGLLAFTFNTESFNDSLSWVILIISIGTGIIIALIVDERAKQAHQEVTTSQNEITELVTKLDETDGKHNEILDLLKKSHESNDLIQFRYDNFLDWGDLQKILTKFSESYRL